MLDKDLFDRFLKNECSAEEQRIVSEFLAAHPEEAAALLPQEEFEQEDPEEWDTLRSDRAFQLIGQRLEHKTHALVRWSLVAATVLTVVVGIKWLLSGSAKPAQQAKTNTERQADDWVTEANITSSTRMLQLPDGSSAELSPGSRVTYHGAFTANAKRLVRLVGEGQFRVADDPSHPFIVVSDELTTTVLGTWFSVSADSGASMIKVHLYSGKVRVGMTAGTQWKTKDSAFVLQPGEELTFSRQNMLAVIRSPQHLAGRSTVKTKRGNVPDVRTTVVHPIRQASAKPEWYMFGGQPLTEVFDQLSDYYGVQINYFPSDVSNHYFTGKFSKGDSLEDILKDIALLHDLTLIRMEGMYVFRKKEK